MMELTNQNINENLSEEEKFSDNNDGNNKRLFSFITPILLILFLSAGIFSSSEEKINTDNNGFYELGSFKQQDKKINLLSESDLTAKIKDTVYTNKDNWLELRIHEQMLYQHWRDGRIEKFPISSGNKYLSESVESRPGLFAIFYRNPHHKSTQYSNASLYHFQTFNQGIGFHSLDGTGYYGNLGVRPSSHGCIRMKHDHARKLFNDCDLGTLVLAHNGNSLRTIGFAPKDIPVSDMPKEEQRELLARNLYNVVNGNYFVENRKYFVVDPKIITAQGIYNGYDMKLPEKQNAPSHVFSFKQISDRTANTEIELDVLDFATADSELNLSEIITNKENNEKSGKKEKDISSTDALIKKYYHNAIGFLPYFGPKK